MINKSQSFLNTVRDQIKSKEAKDFVSVELDYHIREAKSEWMKKGVIEAEAEEKAVKQMGSPITLGQKLNKLHRPKVDWLTVILLITILGLGFLPMISLGYMDDGHFSTYKVIFVILGGAVALGIMLIDYRKLEKLGWLFYSIGILNLLLLKFMYTTTINGMPVIVLGHLTIESLMAVPFFFLAWAALFNNRKLKLWHVSILFIISFYLFFTTFSISTTYIYSVMVFVMFWWSKFSRKTILTTVWLTVSLFFIFGFILWQSIKTYQIMRILVFLNPEKYPNDGGSMILLIKELMSKAGWFGNSVNKEIIPFDHTILVFVSFTYYYGWLLAIVLVVLLLLFAARIIVVSRKINDSYGKLLLIGAVALYTVQLVSNIGMTLGFFPITTMSLPFISYGLMPIMLNAFLIGIVLSVYRRKDLSSSRFFEMKNN